MLERAKTSTIMYKYYHYLDIIIKEYKIYTVAINENGVNGCRVTPNLFTSTLELDKLIYAIKKIANA